MRRLELVTGRDAWVGTTGAGGGEVRRSCVACPTTARPAGESEAVERRRRAATRCPSDGATWLRALQDILTHPNLIQTIGAYPRWIVRINYRSKCTTRPCDPAPRRLRRVVRLAMRDRAAPKSHRESLSSLTRRSQCPRSTPVLSMQASESSSRCFYAGCANAL